MNQNITLLDGAMGTQIWEKTGESKPVWLYNMTHPEVVLEVHKAYIKAGVDIILSNTFGANRQAVYRASSYTVTEVVQAGMRVAKSATVGTNVKVALSVGPLMELLEPYGDLTEEEAIEIYTEQIGAAFMGQDKPDMVLLETFMDAEMMRVAATVAKSYGVPVLCSLTFEKIGKTLMGQSVEDVIEILAPAEIDAIGMNCSLGPDLALPIIERFANATPLPLIFKPNAGMPVVVGSKTTFPYTAEEFTSQIKEALSYVTYLGGCCGTTPAHIQTLKSLLS